MDFFPLSERAGDPVPRREALPLRPEAPDAMWVERTEDEIRLRHNARGRQDTTFDIPGGIAFSTLMAFYARESARTKGFASGLLTVARR